MKTSFDPRHIKRQHIVQDLFKADFHKQPVSDKAKEVLTHLEILNSNITKAAPEFPLDKINKVDLAISRLAVFELLIEKKEPVNVIIDEAVELGKEFSGEASPSFINGVLGNIITHEKSSTD